MVKTPLCMKFYKCGSQECDKHGLHTKPDVCYDVGHSGGTSIYEHLLFCLQLNHRQPIFEQPDLLEGACAHGRGLNLGDLLRFPPTCVL